MQTRPPPVYSRVLDGLTAHKVSIECHVGAGLPNTTIVGLPEAAVREARDRVETAITASGFSYPDGKVVINLAPGHLAKRGSALDLPMAIAVLLATGQIPADCVSGLEFVGELSLFGRLRPVKGALVCALDAARSQRRLIVPAVNEAEAAVAPAGTIGLAKTLAQTATLLRNREDFPSPAPAAHETAPGTPPFQDIVGQAGAKRALTIAACGGHHLLMIGPPGTGKTLLARSAAGLLPLLSEEETLEVAAIYSAAGYARKRISDPPFRDPHHSASAQALIGGGRQPTPGELSLAHRGILFLDEAPHFKPSALNLLREPIETGETVLARASYHIRFPSRFQLIIAMNPCPAGRICREDACRCSPPQVRAYQSRLSGPLLDRIDIQVGVPPLPAELVKRLHAADPPQDDPRPAIKQARRVQLERQGCLNSALSGQGLAALIRPALKADRDDLKAVNKTLEDTMQRQQISVRSLHKIWRVALSIADLEGETNQQGDIVVGGLHLSEALSYRNLDWESGVSVA